MPRFEPRVDRALVLRLWDEDRLGTKQIAHEAGCSPQHVGKIVKSAGRPPRPTREERRRAAMRPVIAAMYRDGAPLKVIAHETGCSTSYVSSVAARLGIERRTPRHEKNGAMIARLYAECRLTLDEIGQIYGCSRTTLKKYARLAGVPKRPVGTWSKERRAA